MTNLLEELNPQQREAVEQTEGPLLILAGAGSGKTRVITYRIAYLIEVKGVDPPSILAVTFTNKAADQMKDRVATLLARRGEDGSREENGSRESGVGNRGEDERDRESTPDSPLPTPVFSTPDSRPPTPAAPPHLPAISTFHSFCVRALRRDIDRIGYSRDFSIYDDDDQARLIKAGIEELGLANLSVTPRASLSRISYWKNHDISPEEAYEKAENPNLQRFAVLYDLYARRLKKANALDFDDLLLKAVDLFYQAPDVCERYNRRFRYMLVDEYQDTNRIQYQLIRQLTLAHQNLCVVGDEDQSIYGWRGADIRNILSFEKDYPSARIIRLERNYRSTQTILDAATSVVSNNEERKGKELWTDRGAGRLLSLYEAGDAEDEAFYVVLQVAQRLEQDRKGSVAVLYRTNAQSRVFEEALRTRGISYRLVGGFSFYARAEVKDAMAYARLAANSTDDAALLRIVNTPPRGIGAGTLGTLQESARAKRLTLWEAIEQEAAEGGLPPRAHGAVVGFYRLMRKLTEDRERRTLPEFFKAILDLSGYRKVLEAENSPEAADRIENLEELVNAAASAAQRGETLAEFIDHAALVSDTDQFDERARVTLMTLHSAKGLEFNTVFLAGLEEGVFPHKLSLDSESGIEEERRLCYVGMTRAKDHLTLSWARYRRSFGQEGFEGSRPSRFLREVPKKLVERVNINQGRSAPKPQTTWGEAVNSVRSVERFFEERGRGSAGAGSGVRKGSQGISFGPAPARAQGRWRVGSRVRHAKYGFGTVMGCEGEGEDAKVTISFPGYGTKKLIERYAGLEKA
ncbi:MAG: ATP-dependent helicase [Terriglobia bacterium]